MKHIIKSGIAVVLLLTTIFIQAQDTRYSQYNYAPMILNPALAGLNACDYRVSFNARTQWTGISSAGNTYTSLTAAADFAVGKATKFKSFAGMGVSFNSDFADGTSFLKNRGDITFAYHFMIDRRGNQSLSIGLQVGINQRGLYGGSKWETQFDPTTGKYNPSLLGESVVRKNLLFIDAGVGALYSIRFRSARHNLYIGVAINHLNQPNVSFFSSGLLADKGPDKLYAKTTIHGGGSIEVKKNLWVMPNFMVLLQGPSYEVNLGTMLRYHIGNNMSRTYVYGGIQYRVLDAVVLQGRLDLGALTIGFSYDINASKLSPSSQTVGGPEICLMYQGCMYHKPRPFLCPVL